MKSVKINLLIVMGLVLLLAIPAQSQFVEFVGGDEGFSVTETSDRGILVTGDVTFGDPLVSIGVLLAKFDASENPVWRTALKWGKGFSVIEVSDEEIVVTGYAYFGAGGGDVILAKFSASGDILWTKTLGGTGNDEGWSVIHPWMTSYVYVTGYTESFGAGSKDLLLARLNASGDPVWTKTLGGAGNDEGRCVILASGGLVVAGYTESFSAGGRDLLLAKFDYDSGDTLWTKILTGAEGWSVIQTSDGGLVVAGN